MSTLRKSRMLSAEVTLHCSMAEQSSEQSLAAGLGLIVRRKEKIFIQQNPDRVRL